MRPEAVIRQAGLILTEIFYGKAGADRLIDGYFRKHRLGQSERALVGDSVYSVLRHKRRLEAMFGDVTTESSATPAQLAACAWALGEQWSPAQLTQLLGLTTSPQQENFTPASQLDLPMRVSLPDWLWTEFIKQWGEVESENLALALNAKPTVDLRVNLRMVSREQAQADLLRGGVPSEPTPYSVEGLRLTRRYALGELASFKRGELEVQDEGSQLISQLLKPWPGNSIIDLCAGGGGKSLHLAALMDDQGQVIASDIDSRRLNRLKARRQRAKLRSIRLLPIKHEGDPKLRRWTEAADGVLVDAPCTGTGTLRRNPEIKWRLTPEQVFVYRQRQGALLDAGARLVKKGGRLVYATCSLLAQENREVVEDFQKQNRSFTLLNAGDEIEGLPHDGPFLTLLPHITKTDGFFAAVFRRKS
jgi:16S rRNA (cytosine967-C5)-methyltransferase